MKSRGLGDHVSIESQLLLRSFRREEGVICQPLGFMYRSGRCSMENQGGLCGTQKRALLRLRCEDPSIAVFFE